MKKTVIFRSFISIAFLFAIAIPKIIYHDAKNVSHKDIELIKDEAHEVLEHPLDFLQIINLVVREKTPEKIYIDAYTFFGLKYAVVEIVIEPQTGQWESTNRLCPSQLKAGLNLFCGRSAKSL